MRTLGATTALLLFMLGSVISATDAASGERLIISAVALGVLSLAAR